MRSLLAVIVLLFFASLAQAQQCSNGTCNVRRPLFRAVTAPVRVFRNSRGVRQNYNSCGQRSVRFRLFRRRCN
jgi:hypothetical protein